MPNIGSPFMDLAGMVLDIDKQNQKMAMEEKELEIRLAGLRSVANEKGFNLQKDGSLVPLPDEVLLARAQQAGAMQRAQAVAGAGVREGLLPGGLDPTQIAEIQRSLAPGISFQPMPSPPRKGLVGPGGQEVVEIPGVGFVTPEQRRIYTESEVAKLRKAKAEARGAEQRLDKIPVTLADGTTIYMPMREAAGLLRGRESATAQAEAKEKAKAGKVSEDLRKEYRSAGDDYVLAKSSAIPDPVKSSDARMKYLLKLDEAHKAGDDEAGQRIQEIMDSLTPAEAAALVKSGAFK